MAEEDWESDSGSLSIDLDEFNRGLANPLQDGERREDVVINEQEEDAAYRELTCSVCYQTMAELHRQRRNEEGHDITVRLGVGFQCLKCTSIMCHDCLVDWAVVTIDALHVPEAWNNVDLLKLKCST